MCECMSFFVVFWLFEIFNPVKETIVTPTIMFMIKFRQSYDEDFFLESINIIFSLENCLVWIFHFYFEIFLWKLHGYIHGHHIFVFLIKHIHFYDGYFILSSIMKKYSLWHHIIILHWTGILIEINFELELWLRYCKNNVRTLIQMITIHYFNFIWNYIWEPYWKRVVHVFYKNCNCLNSAPSLCKHDQHW